MDQETPPLRLTRIEVLARNNPTASDVLMRGIYAYGRRHRHWRYNLTPIESRNLTQTLGSRSFDGVIAVVWDEPMAEQLRSFGKPVVNIHEGVPHAMLPAVVVDDRKVGELAAEHLVSQGFRSFAYFGVNTTFSITRETAFMAALSRRGFGCERLLTGEADGRRLAWHQKDDLAMVHGWLLSLPRPLGILAGNDELAAALMDAAEHAGLRVPHDVAVMGVDNAGLRCFLSAVPLTSVDPGQEAMGFAAAALLDRLMQGHAPPPEPVVVPPAGVVARQSTERLIFEDGSVTEGVRLIGEQAVQGLTVDDLVEALGVSRSTLERRFRRHLGRPPADEIRRVRLESARRLLLETDAPMVEVAVDCGFGSISYLSTAFRRAFGVSPSRYRQRHRIARGGVPLARR